MLHIDQFITQEQAQQIHWTGYQNKAKLFAIKIDVISDQTHQSSLTITG